MRRARSTIRLACLAATAAAWAGLVVPGGGSVAAAQDAPPVAGEAAREAQRREAPTQKHPRAAEPNVSVATEPAEPRADPRELPLPERSNRSLIWDRARLRADLERRRSETRRELMELMATHGARHPRVEQARLRLEALAREVDVLEKQTAPRPAEEVPAIVMERAAYLGVAASPTTPVLQKHLKLPEGVGLVVDYIEPGSPAEVGGLEVYDVLVRLDEQLLVNSQQLAVLVRTYEPRSEVKLRIVRAGEPSELGMRLVEREVKPIEYVEFWDPNAPADVEVLAARQLAEPVPLPAREEEPIEAGSVISIAVHNLQGPGLTTTVSKSLDANGTIKLPLLDAPVRVVGLTPVELQGEIVEAYRKARVQERAEVSVSVSAPADELAAPAPVAPPPPPQPKSPAKSPNKDRRGAR